MSKWTELSTGILLLVLAGITVTQTRGLGFWDFSGATWEFFKGGLIWLVALIGFLFLALGISDFRS